VGELTAQRRDNVYLESHEFGSQAGEPLLGAARRNQLNDPEQNDRPPRRR
jgi:hypothetical protein